MSVTLKNLLKAEITTVVKGFGTKEFKPKSDDPEQAQNEFIDKLSEAIAKSVYQYLTRNVQQVLPAIPAGPGPLTIIP